MQNDPPFNSEAENARPHEESGQDDLTLKQQDQTLIASSNVSHSSETIESALPGETTPAPTGTAQPQAQSAAPVQAAQAGAVPATPQPLADAASTQVAQAGAVPVTPQPVIPATPHVQAGAAPQGYIVPPGYVISQGYLVPQGYVVYQGYVVPQSYVPQQGLTPPPGSPIPQPGYVPQPGYIPQPGYAPQQSAYTQTQPPLPPGYAPPGLAPQPPRRPRLPRDRFTLVTLGSIALLVLILLGVIAVAIARSGGSPTPGATATVAPQITPTPNTSLGKPTSAFQAANCPFEANTGLIQSKQLSCGYVTVPENHSQKNGKQVKLAVAIFRAQQYINTVDPAPVLRLDGGPGGPSLPGWAQVINSTNIRQFVFNHDVIMFDQRGTGYSTPSLLCTELLSDQDISAQMGVTPYEQAAHTCYNRLTSQGINLSDFNTIQNAADVADIIHALGYPQMTLYGVSYGTRLALTTMRLYPSVVHATVLDSVYPPNHNRADLPSDAQRVFSVLFQGCQKDPNCNTKYPNLQSTFYSLVDQLNAHPASFDTVDATSNQQYHVTFAGDDMISFVFSALYVTSLIPAIPQIIFQIKAQKYTELASVYGQLIFDDTFSQGLFYSAECSEDWPFLTTQDITTSEQGIEPHLAKVFGQEDEQQEYDICQFWKVDKVPDAQKQVVTSSIPTLITTGEYDPITPPANGQEAGKTLNHSYFFQFPGQGHGQLYSSLCSDQIISAFEDNPTVQPDGSCITQMTEPQFI